MRENKTISANVTYAMDSVLFKNYGKRMMDIIKPCRIREVFYLRSMCISLYQMFTNCSITAVARYFERDRSCIYRSLELVDEMMGDPYFKHDYELLKVEIEKKLNK